MTLPETAVEHDVNWGGIQDQFKAQEHLRLALNGFGLDVTKDGLRRADDAISSIGPVNLANPNLFGLRPREQEVLGLMATGQSNKAIASASCIAESTVKCHLSAIYEKIGVVGRADAVRMAHICGAQATAGVIDTSHVLRLFTGNSVMNPWAQRNEKGFSGLTQRQQVAAALMVVAHRLLSPEEETAALDTQGPRR